MITLSLRLFMGYSKKCSIPGTHNKPWKIHFGSSHKIFNFSINKFFVQVDFISMLVCILGSETVNIALLAVTCYAIKPDFVAAS